MIPLEGLINPSGKPFSGTEKVVDVTPSMIKSTIGWLYPNRLGVAWRKLHSILS